jgi:hypothetical protein
MKRVLGALVACGMAVALAAPTASAEPQGIPNCHGQQVKFFATTFGGAAHAAEAFGLTVQQGHNVLLILCGRTHGVTPHGVTP